MTKRRSIVLGIVGAAAITAVLFLSPVRAQMRDERQEPKYSYVGLNNNVARIDAATGRVWVLKVSANVDRRAGVNDIVTYPRHEWKWMEVRIDGVHDVDDSEAERVEPMEAEQ